MRVFGRKSTFDPWLYHIDSCIFCLMKMDIQIRVKPDTASVRVLSIDGGGTRGRAPLEFVRVLQERIGLPCLVQRYFDMAYGTSSGESILYEILESQANVTGAIIACALFINGWSVEDCIASFEDLSRLAFKPSLSCWIPILSNLYAFISSLLFDSKYSAGNLETALRMAFGSTRSIMDCSKASEFGTLVGMPVTTIRDVRPCISTNYNGAGKRDNNSGTIDRTTSVMEN